MEPLHPLEVAYAETEPCINCGQPGIVPGHTHKLCATCRTAFVKFPVPQKIKLFAAGIAIVLLFALFKLPEQLSTGIHLKRAIQAEKESRFVTAEQELHQVLNKEPAYTEALAHLLIASYYNQERRQFYDIAEQLQNKSFDDEELLQEVNTLLDKTNDWYPPETMQKLFDTYHTLDSIPDHEINAYLHEYPKQPFAMIACATRMLNNEQYTQSDSIMNKVDSITPGNLSGLLLHIATKRGLRQFDAAIQYCDLLLEKNQEQCYALAAKARALLQQGHLKEGLALADKTSRQFPEDGYCKGTLALAWHVNNQPAKRDALLNELRRDSVNAEYAQYVADVISNKEKF